MKIIEKIKNVKRLKVFVLSFVLFLIIFYLIDCAVTLVSAIRVNAIGAIQASLYETLRKHVAKQPDTVPDYLLPVPLGKGHYHLKREDTYYYPEVWNKPGRILLKRRCGNFYHIICGDGTVAWVIDRYYLGDNVDIKGGRISRSYGRKYIFGNFWFIPLGAITIAITLFLTKREEKRKKAES